MNDNDKAVRKGRYAIITTSITAIASVLSSLIAYSLGQKNMETILYDDFKKVSAEKASIDSQLSLLQKEFNSLNDKYILLQNVYQSSKQEDTGSDVPLDNEITKEAVEEVSLKSLYIIDNCNVKTEDGFTDSYGNSHEYAFRTDSFYESYVIFNLNEKYSSLSAWFAASPDTHSAATMAMYLYVDDKLVKTVENIAKQNEPVYISNIDLGNGKTLLLKSKITDGGNLPEAYCYIVDAMLS